MKSPIFAALGVAACLLFGCESAPQASYEHMGLVKVSGTVTLDGNPLPNATVKFESEDGQFSFGKTNESGAYSLQFDSEKKGTTPGVKTVRISTSATLGEEDESEEGGEESPESAGAKAPELVPANYNTQSELKRTVEPGKDQTFNFHLTTK